MKYFDKDIALQLDAAIVAARGVASLVAPEQVSKKIFATDQQINKAGMMHFGLAMLGSAATLAAMSRTKDEKMKRAVLIADAAIHAGHAVVAGYGKKKKFETKKGMAAHIAMSGVSAGVAIAGACMKAETK